MGRKTTGKKGLEKEKNQNEEPSSLTEASHSENGAKLHDEDKANHEISGKVIEFEASQSEARMEINVDVEKKKKKKKKRREASGNYVELSVNVDVEKKKKKKKKKKRHEASGNDVELSACEIEPDNVDGDMIKQKKNEKRRENGGNDIDSSVWQCEARRESNVEKDKKKKTNKKLQEDSGYGADQNDVVVESHVHVDKKRKSEDREMNGEEGEQKKKKKRKRDKGGDDFAEVNYATDVEAGKDRGQTNDVHVDKKKKSEGRQMNGEEVDCKKKEKRKRDKRGNDFPEVNNATNVEAGKDRDQTDEKMMENVNNPRNKKKGKQKHGDTVTAENHKETPKKVSFSDHVEVFTPHTGLVRGKRFSQEEDEIVRNAVLSYIEIHQLGEEGLNMVLNCKSHPKVRNCWKEIGAALPWRPYESVYYRAHILFERDENRKWSPEELELLRKFHEKHGNEWKKLAVSIGKHRFQVKDAWRRIKLPDRKKGHWSHDEYQNLFELVNLDLRVRATEERKSKHGMLRDNIGWEAISDKLGTRSYALCCQKWYYQISSPLVAEGKWTDLDDYHLMNALSVLDACCIEDVDWDNLLEHRPGNICLTRWNQMVKHLGPYVNKSFADQVEVLSQRYCLDVLEAREAYDSKPAVDEDSEQERD